MLVLRNIKYAVLKIIGQVFMMDGVVLGNRSLYFSFPSSLTVPALSVCSGMCVIWALILASFAVQSIF